MSQPKLLTETIQTVLKSVGFKQKKSTWYKETDDLFQVVNLQKSDFSNLYYLNVAFWLKPLAETELPQEHLCHIRGRWEDIICPIDAQGLESLLDLEDPSLSEKERLAHIVRLLTIYLVPFFQRLESLSLVRQAYLSKSLGLPMVTVKAQEFLRIER